jgi:hypothetical protein
MPVTVQKTTSTPSRQPEYVSHRVDPMLYVSAGVVEQPLRIAQPLAFGAALE